MKPINEMTDPEMDEAIAVEVMKWTLGDTDIEWGFRWLTDKDGKHVMDISLWHPCKDMNQAWEAVYKFREGKELYTAMGIHHDGEHYAEIEDVAKDKLIGRSGNNNLARAICEALLMAVRGEQ